MKKENSTPEQAADTYDDGNIPDIDLPHNTTAVEPLPESIRPRKDGPGGN